MRKARIRETHTTGKIENKEKQVLKICKRVLRGFRQQCVGGSVEACTKLRCRKTRICRINSRCGGEWDCVERKSCTDFFDYCYGIKYWGCGKLWSAIWCPDTGQQKEKACKDNKSGRTEEKECEDNKIGRTGTHKCSITWNSTLMVLCHLLRQVQDLASTAQFWTKEHPVHPHQWRQTRFVSQHRLLYCQWRRPRRGPVLAHARIGPKKGPKRLQKASKGPRRLQKTLKALKGTKRHQKPQKARKGPKRLWEVRKGPRRPGEAWGGGPALAHATEPRYHVWG